MSADTDLARRILGGSAHPSGGGLNRAADYDLRIASAYAAIAQAEALERVADVLEALTSGEPNARTVAHVSVVPQ